MSQHEYDGVDIRAGDGNGGFALCPWQCPQVECRTVMAKMCLYHLPQFGQLLQLPLIDNNAYSLLVVGDD